MRPYRAVRAGGVELGEVDQRAEHLQIGDEGVELGRLGVGLAVELATLALG